MKIRHIGESFLVCLCSYTLPFMSRRGVVGLSRWLGNRAYNLSAKLRKMTHSNLDLAFGDSLSEDEKVKIARRSFCSISLVLLDLFWFSRFSSKRTEKYIQFDSSFDSYFKSAPAVAVSGHFGNWEALGLAVAQHGDPMMSVATPLDNPFVNKTLNRLRSVTGQKISKREGAVRDMMRSLRSEGRVGILMDQNILPEQGGVFVDFMGLPVPMTNAAETLSIRAKADIVFIYCIADDDGMYTASSLKPLKHDELVENETTQIIASQLEDVVRKHPDKWMWMYKRWKYAPVNAELGDYPYYARKMEE